jgi:hypothetical protein
MNNATYDIIKYKMCGKYLTQKVDTLSNIF